MKTTWFVAGLLWMFWATAAGAQTNDGNFRGWAYYEDVTSPRAAGLGGAFVAVTDDASVVPVNPAGLTTLTKTDVQVALLQRKGGTFASGDQSSSATAPGFIGGAGRITKTIALGGYITEPHDIRLGLTPSVPDSGFLRTRVTDGGVAAAWSPAPMVHLGVRLNITHLEAEGQYVHDTGTGGLSAAQAAAQSKLAGDVGLLLTFGSSLSAGVSFTEGARWDASRISQPLIGGATSGEGFQLSSPSRLRGGLSYRPTPKVLLTGEVDYVFLSRLETTFLPALQPAQTAEYVLDSAAEARAGVELSVPIRSALSLQARGGVWSQAPAAFAFTGTNLPRNGSPFPGDTRRTIATLGAGVAARAVHLDFAAAFGGARTVLTLGAGIRF